tara:strand:- start:11 stop:403 length:393 start_codon:yes stop_codon:yes gene_type:complete
MTSELRVNTLKDASGNNSVATSVLAKGSAKAYVQFSDEDGTFDVVYNTVNVSSTDDNGDGDIDYNLTANMSDANYPASGEAGGNFSSFFSRIISHGGSTSSNVRFRCTNSGTYTTGQGFRMSSIIHGDLA